MPSTWKEVTLQHLSPDNGGEEEAKWLTALFNSRTHKPSFGHMNVPNRNSVGVIARDVHGKVVGCVVGRIFHTYAHKGTRGTCEWNPTKTRYISHLSWVAPKYRRRGLVKRLWSALLNIRKVTDVEITVVTDRGLTMAQALERRFARRVSFEIEHGGDRTLRDLRLVRSAQREKL